MLWFSRRPQATQEALVCPQALKTPPFLTFADDDLHNRYAWATLEYNYPIAHYVNCQELLYDIFFRGHDSTIVMVGPGFASNLRILRNTTFLVDGESATFELQSNAFHHYNAYLVVSGLAAKGSVRVEAPDIGFKATLTKTRPLSGLRVAAQTIYKGDEDLLPMWIAYHHQIGFDAFFLYKNDETPTNITTILTKLVQDIKKPITIIIWSWPYPYFQPFELGIVNSGQVTAQNHAIQRYKYDVSWLLLNDNDEYLVPRQHSTVNEWLKTVPEKFAAVSLETVWFGCPPPGTEYNNDNFIQHLTLRKDESEGRWFRMKVIIRPTVAHLVITHIVVDSDGLLLYMDPNIAWLNHYRTITRVSDRSGCRDAENVEDTRIVHLFKSKNLYGNIID
ncbi:hypothetical protein SmJEL517_g02708 [Synchytrium microbalum]|uniref:Glycosyltransferase family 92 protein n=1 Tax=Synchytrium microbalum TaxID=1806994 RepID=A0A507C4R8_9FUNG|nr:uncharacterized protein SmJEL517_g02708 [Synchytrium microbalum]TPX34672.1 hypothetical protein SmJEL517_g02708 [Synchytrium microbalum]